MRLSYQDKSTGTMTHHLKLRHTVKPESQADRAAGGVHAEGREVKLTSYKSLLMTTKSSHVKKI